MTSTNNHALGKMSEDDTNDAGASAQADDNESAYSRLDAFLGRERADTVRGVFQRLAQVEDRLEQEYIEDMTDPYIAERNAAEMEQSGGADMQSGQ